MNQSSPAMDKEDQTSSNKSQQRKRYISPELQHFGKIKEVTLGGSLGLGDSGNPTVQKVPI